MVTHINSSQFQDTKQQTLQFDKSQLEPICTLGDINRSLLWQTPPSLKSIFQYDFSSTAAKHNFDILKKHNFDFKKVWKMNVHFFSVKENET